jgi:hypothetical protein
VVGTWRKTKPDKLTRRRQISIAKWYALNFDGDRQGDGLHVMGNAQLRNFWSAGVNGFKRWRSSNDGLTRGGPSALAGAALGGGGWVETDDRKRVTGAVEAYWSSNEYGSHSFEGFLRLTFKPSSGLSLSLSPTFTRYRTVAQWVGAFEDPLATATYGSRYVFGQMDQTEWSGSIRLNWILSPRLSLQLYAQPLVSAGDYEGFKEFLRPRSFDFAVYGKDKGVIRYDPSTATYVVAPGGGAPLLTFSNPDFNWKSLRVNAVARWEYRPGSTLYLVWTQGRTNDANPGDFDLGRDVRDLLDAPADDVLMVKVSYRFGR